MGHLPGARREFTQRDFDRFARLTRDDNPIHVDPAYCRKTSFGRPVAHGMLLYATISGLVQARFRGCVPLGQTLVFPNGTPADEALDVALEVTSVDGSTAVVTSRMALPDGSITCEGATTVLLPRVPIDLELRPRYLQPPRPGDATLRGLTPGQRATSSRTFTHAELAEYVDLTGHEEPCFGDGVVPGPLLCGMFSDLLGTRLPGRGTGWLKELVSYPDFARVGEDVSATVEIVRLREDTEVVDLTTTCTTADGRVVCEGRALVWVRNLV